MKQFRELTKEGESFIIKRCQANSEIFTKKTKLKLPKSNLSPDPITKLYTFSAIILDDDNNPITTATDYAKNLIKWYNFYSNLYLVDANIMAAQGFIESKYSPLSFNDTNAMGISGLIDYEIFNIMFSGNENLTDNDAAKFRVNITGDSSIIQTFIPFINTGDGSTKSDIDQNELAKNNRLPLFQNIANNPKLSIFCQCYLMSNYGNNNSDFASSSLFNYYVRSTKQYKNYGLVINDARLIFGKEGFTIPVNYVNDIFKVLSGKYPQISGGFGYVVDFNQTVSGYESTPDNPKNNDIVTTVTKELLVGCMPYINKSDVELYLNTLNANISKFKINTKLRLVHFLSQTGHESGDLKFLIENLNYSSDSILKTSPFNKHFKTKEDTLGYVNNPVALANIGYNNRSGLGNGGGNDGYNYRGRGAIQITGKLLYKQIGDLMGLDLIATPSLLEDKSNSLISSMHVWNIKNLNRYADKDDVLALTKAINGGTNGLDNRIVRTKRSKAAFDI